MTKLKINPADLWAENEFEDNVAGALIACYETKIKKLRGVDPSDRLNDERLAVLRRQGVYIPGNSRLVELPTNDEDQPSFDLVNDVLPVSGIFGSAVPANSMVKQKFPDAYFMAFHLKQVSGLTKNWHRRSGGQLYEFVQFLACTDGRIEGERRFLSVAKNGEIFAAEKRLQSSYMPGSAPTFARSEEHTLKETEAWGSATLQFLADKRFAWAIKAQDGTVACTLGCMREEIKSLLYARSLPMTSTGRKRPILHLVEAHKRRLRNGTDINVEDFLRGVPEVTIGSTKFTVQPAQVLGAQLNERSKRLLETLTQ